MIFVRPALAGMILCLFLAAAHADDMHATAQSIKSADEIILSDGRIVRLAGIKAWPGAAGFLQNAVAGHDVILQNAVIDRYGRVDATVSIAGQKETVEDALLHAGLAFVYPATGDDARINDWLAAERAARRDKCGDWPDHADVASDDAEKLYGQYGFVSGVVMKAERVKNKVYLNFGADWRTDFTIQIAAHDLRAFKNADIDPLTLQGKKIRARGWVKRDFGPMITATDPRQIEVMP